MSAANVRGARWKRQAIGSGEVRRAVEAVAYSSASDHTTRYTVLPSAYSKLFSLSGTTMPTVPPT